MLSLMIKNMILSARFVMRLLIKGQNIVDFVKSVSKLLIIIVFGLIIALEVLIIKNS